MATVLVKGLNIGSVSHRSKSVTDSSRCLSHDRHHAVTCLAFLSLYGRL